MQAKAAPHVPQSQELPITRPAAPPQESRIVLQGEAPTSYETLHYRTRFSVRAAGTDETIVDLIRNRIADWLTTTQRVSVEEVRVLRATTDEHIERVTPRYRIAQYHSTTEAAEDWLVSVHTVDAGFKRRMWHTVIALHIPRDGDAIVNVITTHCVQPGTFGKIYPPQASVPAIALMLLQDERLICETNTGAIATDVTDITDEQALQSLLHLVTLPKRTLPVILVTIEQRFDAVRLTQQTLGMCETYRLAPEMMDTVDRVLNECGIDPTLVVPDALNIYLPGIDAIGSHDGTRHYVYPSWQVTKYGIGRTIDQIRGGLMSLVQATCEEPTSHAALESLRDHERSEHLKGRLDAIKREAAEQADRDATASETISQLQRNLTEMTKLAETYSADLDIETQRAREADERADDARRQIYELTAQVETLNHALSEVRAGAQPTFDLERLPQTTTDLLAMAERMWPNRVTIHEDAWRSAKEYEGPLDEQWDIIRACATVLWPLVFEEDDLTYDKTFQSRCGYEFAVNESSETREKVNLMKLRCHVIDGVETQVCAHIKGKNVRTHFRLYPHIDREHKRIVIVHAGRHLESAGTRHHQ